MPVHQDLAYDLLKTFSKLEFQLRRHGDFFRKRRGEWIAGIDWSSVEDRVRLLGDTLLDDVPLSAKQHLLCQRDERPMKQQIVEEDQRLVARFKPCPLDSDSDAVALCAGFATTYSTAGSKTRKRILTRKTTTGFMQPPKSPWPFNALLQRITQCSRVKPSNAAGRSAARLELLEAVETEMVTSSVSRLDAHPLSPLQFLDEAALSRPLRFCAPPPPPA